MSIRVTPVPAILAHDPDDTEGRRLYRARADSLARAQLAYERRSVKLKAGEIPQPNPATPPASS